MYFSKKGYKKSAEFSENGGPVSMARLTLVKVHFLERLCKRLAEGELIRIFWVIHQPKKIKIHPITATDKVWPALSSLKRQ